MEIKIFEANEEDLKTILDLQKECLFKRGGAV